MPTITELCESIATTISDYRAGEIVPPNAQHVQSWIAQFPIEDRKPVLSELSNVLSETYFSRDRVRRFLKGLIANKGLVGNAPKDFWRAVNFLNIQGNGSSQRELLQLFDVALKAEVDLKVANCGGGNVFVYLDDAIFTGSRCGSDLEQWIAGCAPAAATVHIIVMALYEFGSWKMDERIKKAAKAAGKNISVHFWRVLQLENRKAYRNTSDVLWPTVLIPEAAEYSGGRFPFEPRQPGGKSKIFSDEEARGHLEQALLRAGMRIRGFSVNPKAALRPLGFSPFGVGFGSTIITYRNCPNNAPLALWWGDPNAAPHHPFSKWRPLVPRKTYGDEDD